MGGLEIVLLIIGIALAIASFIFSSKLDGDDTQPINNAELTERQRAAIEKQIVDIFEEKMEEESAKQDAQLDLISVSKKKDMDEYAETILNEINRNHNEVMFLYDMLNEKKKEITVAVRDANLAKASVESAVASAEVAPATEPVKKTTKKTSTEKATTEKTTAEKTAAEKTAAKKKKASVLDQLDAVSEAVTDEVLADEEKPVKKKKTTKATAKTAASRAKAVVLNDNESADRRSSDLFETGNNNEKILELNRQGKSNVEIAKQLGIGIGEVKLVIDLFKGGRS